MCTYNNSGISRMVYSLAFIKPAFQSVFRQTSDIRAQSFPSENDRSGNIVDANMSILRRRIKDIRQKQRVERGHRPQKGWNYEPNYLHNVKRKDKRELVKFLDLVTVVGIAFGVTCASGTILLSLLSILVHLNL